MLPKNSSPSTMIHKSENNLKLNCLQNWILNQEVVARPERVLYIRNEELLNTRAAKDARYLSDSMAEPVDLRLWVRIST